MASTKRYKYPLVVVQWQDAHSDSSWEVLADLVVKPTEVTSAGFLARADDEAILLTLGYSDDSVLDRLRIPKGMVRSITVIRQASPPNGPSEA